MATHTVLFSRASNENLLTPMYASAAYTEGMVDLKATGTFCWAWDDDRLVSGDLYDVREVSLPDFLSVEEWLAHKTAWKWAWACGVDASWKAEWQRSLAYEVRDTAQRLVCCKLLGTKKFRSGFREAMRDQLVAWLETPAAERKYSSPFSYKQWACLTNRYVAREARQLDGSLYSYREDVGCPTA